MAILCGIPSKDLQKDIDIFEGVHPALVFSFPALFFLVHQKSSSGLKNAAAITVIQIAFLKQMNHLYKDLTIQKMDYSNPSWLRQQLRGMSLLFRATVVSALQEKFIRAPLERRLQKLFHNILGKKMAWLSASCSTAVTMYVICYLQNKDVQPSERKSLSVLSLTESLLLSLVPKSIALEAKVLHGISCVALEALTQKIIQSIS